ncbi:MAG: magnesium transporter [Polyangiaceae bacterium]|nr:magnesium transporter [Polyangiaceae bacterium]
MMRVAVAIVPEVRQLLAEDPSELGALLEEMHDEDIADLVGLLNEEEAGKLLKALKAEEAAPIFERLDEETQETLVGSMGMESIAPIVGEMAADDRVDLIEGLPEEVGDTLLETLEKVDPEAAAEVEQLAQWPEDSAGGLMTTDYVSVGADLTVAGAIERIRGAANKVETVYYVYIVTEKNRLHGVASLRDLLLAEPNAKMQQVMTEDVVTVAPETDQEEVAKTMAKYDFYALPVLGADRKLLGVITVDDVMDVLTQEQTEDVQKLGGMAPIEESYFQTGFWTFVQKRFPWLAIMFVGEFATGTVMQHYDVILERITRLSFYVPLLISTGGNSGSQSSTLIIRGLATGDIKPSHYWRIALREAGQGLVLGTALGAIGLARVAWLGHGQAFMWTIAGTLVAICVVGCTVGSMFPLLLKKLGLDPATSSAPFIASLVDVFGILIYLNIAKIFMADMIAKAVAGHAGG